MTTFVPGWPRSLLTASFRSRFTVDCSSILMTWSFDLMPARAAGVSLMTRTTVSRLLSMRMTKPRPPNSPFVCSFISLKASGPRKTEWGSRVDSMPATAAYSMSLGLSVLSRCCCMKPKMSRRVNESFQRESTPLMSKSLVAVPTVMRAPRLDVAVHDDVQERCAARSPRRRSSSPWGALAAGRRSSPSPGG